MSQTSLASKLRLQAGQRALALNAPETYLSLLGELPGDVHLDSSVSTSEKGAYDWVHLFVRDVAELARLGPLAVRAAKYDAVLWISYPKRSARVDTDLSRDVGWDIIAAAGLRPVMQVSVDATWSALRFRPTEQVGR